MTTDLGQSWVSARTSTVNEISLFPALESEELTSAFLKFYNDWLARKIVALTPAERAPFALKLISDVLIRVRAIESGAPAQQSRSIH
jgi:hypothetical protein